VQEENLMFSNNPVSVCGGVASLIDERGSMDHWWDDIDRAEPKYCAWRRSSHSVSLSTTKSMWAGLGSNPGFHGERVVTSCPSHGMAQEENVEYSIM